MNKNTVVVFAILLVSVAIAAAISLFITRPSSEPVDTSYLSEGSYGASNGACDMPGSVFHDDEGVRELVKSIQRQAGGEATCYAANLSYAFTVFIPSTGAYYCVDSTGFSGTLDHNITAPLCN